MKAKDYLKRLKRLDTIIRQKQQEITDLRLTASSTGGFDYSKERVQSSPSGDAPFVRPVLKIIELEQQINAEIDRYVEEKHKIIQGPRALSFGARYPIR